MKLKNLIFLGVMFLIPQLSMAGSQQLLLESKALKVGTTTGHEVSFLTMDADCRRDLTFIEGISEGPMGHSSKPCYNLKVKYGGKEVDMNRFELKKLNRDTFLFEDIELEWKNGKNAVACISVFIGAGNDYNYADINHRKFFARYCSKPDMDTSEINSSQKWLDFKELLNNPILLPTVPRSY